jgi:hypothetical protein
MGGFKQMNKYITCILLTTALIGITARPCRANSPEAGVSAVPKFREVKTISFDYRVYTLRKFLGKFNSPLTPYSQEFIRQADYYDIDWRMMPAITGVESTFGKQIPAGSYNAYGWANGNYSFKSWSDSIKVVSKTLKYNYIDKGAVSITGIAKIYAPPSTTWGAKVKYFVSKIDTLPLSFDI